MPSFPGFRSRFVPLLAGLLLLAPRPRAQDAGDPAPSPARSWTWEITPEHLAIARALRESRRAEAAPAEELVVRIVVAGPGALAAQFDILVRRRVPETGPDDRPQTLSDPQRDLVLAALARMDGAAVREKIESRVAGAPDDGDVRLAAIHALGAVGNAKDLSRIVQLAPRESAEDMSLPSAVRLALRNACKAILRRDGRSYLALHDLVGSTDADAGRALLEALGATRDARALGVLHRATQALPELRPQAAALAVTCGRSMDPALDQEFADWAMSELAAARPEYARTLLQAMGSLDDGNCVPAMIERLEDKDAGVRDSALFALRRVSGLGLPPQAAAWLAWHRDEVAWHAHKRGRLCQDLQSGDASRIIGALRAYSERRTRRSELSSEVERVLADRRPELRRLACETLARLGSASACVALLGVLQDPDATVAEAAWRSLQEITGLDLPHDPGGIRAILRTP